MPDLDIQGTTVSLPNSGSSPNWAEGVIEALELLAEAANEAVGTYDIAPQTFDISSFNSATNENISNLSFSTATVRMAIITYYVYRTTNSENAVEAGTIIVDYNANRSTNEKWNLVQVNSGDASITFSMTDAGQMQFTTTALSGTGHSGKIGFSAKALQQSY